MYERAGMGWSEIPWYSWAALSCGRGQFDACVTTSAEDQRWAQSPAWIGGPPRCTQFRATLTGGTRNCTTEDDRSGTVHCCRETALTPEAVEAAQAAQVEPTPSGTLPSFRPACETRRSDRSLMRTDTQRALWDVQARLCEIRDPGPVDGTARHSSFVGAIRHVQRERGLPITGMLDAVTLRTIGFSTAEAQQIAGLVARTSVGTMPDTPPSLSYNPMLILGGVGSAAFFAYATWRYMRRR